MRIRGSGALVTGGASGLGEATARRLHAAGATVTIADVNVDRGQAVASELGIRFVACDVRDEAQLQAAVDAAGAEVGLRIAVSCAGTGWAQRVAGTKGPHPLLAFETIIAINLVGTFNLLRFAAQKMICAEPDEFGNRGVCINTASVAAFEGQTGQTAYSASKGGVVAMTLPAARDLASSGIRVVTIAPGAFDTQLLAALPEPKQAALVESAPYPKRPGRPDEYAQLVAHIVENDMLNGETIRLDGAIRLSPK